MYRAGVLCIDAVEISTSGGHFIAIDLPQAPSSIYGEPAAVAAQVAKVIRSATANAENELLSRASDLRVVEIYANEGPPLKRFRARAKGRPSQIRRRNSHMTVVLDEEEL